MAHIIDAVFRLTDNLTQPLQKAQKSLTNYNRQVTRCGKDMLKFSKSVTSMGKTLTTTVATPLAGIGAAAVKTTMEFDKILSAVNALSDGGETGLVALREKALELGASTVYSASEVAEGFKFMAQAGWDTNDMLEGASGVLDAAASSGEDLATVTNIVANTLSSFGMKASESARVADVLATAAAASTTDITQIGDAFTYAGSIAGSFNYSIEDTALALGLLANSGINASNAGTALRKIMTETNGAFSVVGDTLGEYVIQTTDANGAMIPFKETMVELRKAFSQLTDAEKSANAEAIAGKTGMAGLLAIVNASNESFNEMAEAIDNSSGKAKEMSEKMLDNLAGQIEEMSGAIESVAIVLGDRLTPYVSKASEKIQELAQSFLDLDSSQQGEVIKSLVTLAAIGPALLIYGKVVGSIAKMVITLGAMGKAIKKAGSVMVWLKGIAALPMLKVVAIITAIALVAGLLIKYWQPIKGFFANIFSAIGNYLESTGLDFENIKNTCMNVVNVLISLFKELGFIFKEVWVNLLWPLLKGIGMGFYLMLKQVMGALDGLMSGVSGVINGIVTVFDGLINIITGVFTNNWALAWEGVVKVFKGIFEGIVGIVKGAINGVIGFINGGIRGVAKIGSLFGGEEVSLPEIPKLYKGADNWKGGLAITQDKGAEIMDLPHGTRVYPHDKSLSMAYQEGKQASTSGNTISIAKLADSIIVREEADIDKIADRLCRKINNVAFNM